MYKIYLVHSRSYLNYNKPPISRVTLFQRCGGYTWLSLLRIDLWKNQRVTAGSSESGLGQVRPIFSSGHCYEPTVDKNCIFDFR